jgi:hypothetical protein
MRNRQNGLIDLPYWQSLGPPLLGGWQTRINILIDCKYTIIYILTFPGLVLSVILIVKS